MLTVTAKLPNERNKEFSYRVIKEGIMSMELQPGQTINESDLAKTLNLSRTPIREVMTKLKAEHLVEVLPQVGTMVSKICPQLIERAAFIQIYFRKRGLKISM